MYIVVSPDTASFTQVGYGFQDQLIYASSLITVEADADLSCPEVVEVVEDGETSSARPMVVLSGPARRASTAMAAGLTAAAAAASARA